MAASLCHSLHRHIADELLLKRRKELCIFEITMEWIKIILPLIGVLLGWLLSESGKLFADKRQDKRKLKKLLYYLLELRYHFAKELSLELDIDKYIGILKAKLKEKLGTNVNDEELEISMETLKPLLQNIVSKARIQDNNYEFLESNIDNILNDLAEIFPIFAYELGGQHKIKERLTNVNNYFTEVESLTPEMPLDLKKLIQPQMTKELLNDIDESIEKIAEKISRRTKRIALEKINKMNFEDDSDDMKKFIDEYLTKIEEAIKAQN
jgi:hypothetical protein